MPAPRLRRAWLRFIGRSLNPLTARAARRGRGPFSLIRHVGRRSGKVYETPVILAAVPEGWIGELTYGPEVQWYRNIRAAGGCEVVRGGAVDRVVAVEEYPTEAGLRAFGRTAVILRLLRRRHFIRLLRG